jgi:hypothetical protein
MINVKLDLKDFGIIDVSVERLDELSQSLNTIKKFINDLGNTEPTTPVVTNVREEYEPMFTKQELNETSVEEATKIFNSAPVTSTITNIPPVPNYSPTELDIDNRPWSPDLHTRTKSKDKDGRWKTKRGLDAPSPVPYAPPPPPPLAASVAVPPPPPPTAPQALRDADRFNKLMMNVVKWENDKKITREQITKVANNLGLESIAFAAGKPEILTALELGLATLAGMPV